MVKERATAVNVMWEHDVLPLALRLKATRPSQMVVAWNVLQLVSVGRCLALLVPEGVFVHSFLD